MATNRKKRVSQIEREIADAVKRSHNDEASAAILDVLDELRKQGVGRSHYALENPYSRGSDHHHGPHHAADKAAE